MKRSKIGLIGVSPTISTLSKESNEFDKLSDISAKTNASFQEFQLSMMYANTVYRLNKKRGSNFTPKKKKRKK